MPLGEKLALDVGDIDSERKQVHIRHGKGHKDRLVPLPDLHCMETFNLPYALRALAWRHQTATYNIVFATASSTLKDFGLNPKHLGTDIGLTAVLHTHSRRLDCHPHLHVIVPGGGVDKAKRRWKKNKGRYLFNASALAKVFRARFLADMNVYTQSSTGSMGGGLQTHRKRRTCPQISLSLPVPRRNQ